MKIEQAERAFAQKLDHALSNVLNELGYSVPDGYKHQVRLKDAHGRKKRSDASAENWSPETGQIVIKFKPILRAVNPLDSGTASPALNEALETSTHSEGLYVHPAEAELLRALDRAESTPGWTFVPLKKFRDEILPLENCPSIRTDVERQNILRSAIDKKLITKKQVQNPRAPQFPVTTIRVNRLLPEVNAILGGGKHSDLDFHPIEISGEPLSTTVLRERR
jgi:hypothetical protein